MYDAIVVGARCAGSPVGMLLARAGYKVLIVERDTFPSDTLSTAHMQPDAVIRMTKWGLLDRLIAAGTPAYAKMNVGFGDIDRSRASRNSNINLSESIRAATVATGRGPVVSPGESVSRMWSAI